MKIKGNRDLLSLLVASIAVVLSQFPPAYQWFHDSELKFTLEPSFVISPNIYSGLSFSRHYSATNVGEEPGRIKTLYVFIVDPEGSLLYEAKAQQYRLQGVLQWVQFSEINLGPGENWSHLVLSVEQVDNRDLNAVQEFQMRIEREAEIWRSERNVFGAPMFEMSRDLLGDLKSFIGEKTGWLKEGKYKVFDAFVTDDDDVRILGHEFAVSDLHVDQFVQQINGFSYGLNSNFPGVLFLGEVYLGGVPQSVMERTESLGATQE